MLHQFTAEQKQKTKHSKTELDVNSHRNGSIQISPRKGQLAKQQQLRLNCVFYVCVIMFSCTLSHGHTEAHGHSRYIYKYKKYKNTKKKQPTHSWAARDAAPRTRHKVTTVAQHLMSLSRLCHGVAL